MNTRAAAAVAAAAAAACELNEEPRLPTLPPAPSAHRRPAPIQAVLNPPAAWIQPATAGNTRSVCCPHPLGGIASQLAGTAACICNRRGMHSSWNQKWHRNVIRKCWLPSGGLAMYGTAALGCGPSAAACQRSVAPAAAACQPVLLLQLRVLWLLLLSMLHVFWWVWGGPFPARSTRGGALPQRAPHSGR